ncbi:hypothetical protein FVEG_16652 [Fusarium verticillioides 7600]|uniref:Uncharacterized protein n=1 Tax=Gibberella moniliformis (strain M3125 / FGSC 7600) TaxID=334819 RepID=W7N1E9_GIBM7|nr:hypothetical protein FVEG_16652 [Fusarium verticillioides 7600]XP_018756749.1 hypothetical protein FVEG_16652 [Fusarium verticillioides 7600]XP_018756750.1 hypothetical protein FVEG_16652 [Fusarium verticillioides 7600]EWG50557.1 hypothetical protein FVEG_16652 [Fusarium verticillioides 7600]EWG50558.1 hypothetical protein FVEG_16652 [Fusarium verticillioides 7600]EWG50559.1 hypothetical protein FVEG_16652 [Fusarium verticillioides 7600]
MRSRQCAGFGSKAGSRLSLIKQREAEGGGAEHRLHYREAAHVGNFRCVMDGLDPRSADKPCDALSCPQAAHWLDTGICFSLPTILVPGMAQTVKRRIKCNAYILIERDACEAQPALLSCAPKGVWAFPLWCAKFTC